MLDVKEAAKKARDFLISLHPNIKHPLLEEVEIDDSGSYWYITLSYPVVDPPRYIEETGGFVDELSYPTYKEYKLFKIDVKSGEVLSMKIRNIK